MNIFVTNESAELEAVVLGIGTDRGEPRAINPMIRKHLEENTFPTEENICREISTFEKVLKDNKVAVYRPSNLAGVEQIFTRDIGFVIDDYFFIANMKYAVRAEELAGIDFLLKDFDPSKIIRFPEGVLIEGGDVILWNNYVFIGVSDRTNAAGVEFLKNHFPNKTVIGFDLIVDQDNADRNILHLDCTFQPIGKDEAIIFYGGFSQRPDVLLDLFPADKLIEVNMDEKNQMFPNIFSISPTKIVIEKGFQRLKSELQKRGYEVFEVDYSETSKLSGLLRCSTLPLRRKSN